MELKKQKSIDSSTNCTWTDYMSLPFTQNVSTKILDGKIWSNFLDMIKFLLFPWFLSNAKITLGIKWIKGKRHDAHVVVIFLFPFTR